MRSFFKSFLASLLAIVVLVLLVVSFAAVKSKEKPKIKDHSYLVIDVYGEILAYDPPDGIMGEIFGGEPETLHRILTNLEKAAVDDRIAGVIIKISSHNTLGRAGMEEIRDAIKDVRDTGKHVYAFSDAMHRDEIYLASACDSIFVPLMADVFLAGFGGVQPYLKGTLEKLGIKANIHKIKDYKSAAELVTREDMSPETREMYTWILDDLWDLEMSALAEARGISMERLVQLMEHALFTAEEAKDAGLVDEILYWNELEARLKREDDKRLRTVSQSDYAKIDRGTLGLKGKKRIAVVHVQGTIGGRQSRLDPMMGLMMGHESVVADLRKARMDEDVAAVVFRIESGGGDGLTSDIISQAVEVLAEEKPVVVSMIDVAASGGYDIAYRATKLVADPMTITGSIGSISGKFNMRGFYKKLGITFDSITKGPNGLIWSQVDDFTEAQRKRFEQNHWDFFNTWLEDVAEHRGMTVAELEKLAHGRVWTGRQAKENGLIDDTGGLKHAIQLAKELSEIPVDDHVTLDHYPKKKNLLETLTGGGASRAAIRWVLYRFIRDDLAESIRMLATSPQVLAID
jgi:protease-4